ncbi:MAG: diguanylate cyclase [Deltaproteobacteria bacterium]|nr:diguanylate cyclase [Deltaproteobacteria bacterium]
MSEWDEDTNITEQADLTSPPAADARNRAYLIVLVGSAVGEMFKLPAGDAVIGRTRHATVRLDDDGVSRVHAIVRAQGDRLVIDDKGSRNGTFVNGHRVNGSAVLADGDKIQVGRTTILKFTYHDSLDENFHEQMYESALRDGLTRLFNKRYFGDRLDGELRFALRHQSALALIMIDVDHFKRINDTRGHVAGDAVLAEVAARLATAVRNEDVVARFGGEEFAIISRATSRADAMKLAERLRRTVAARPIIVEDGAPLPVTVSIGVAAYPEVAVKEPDDLIEAADKALYRAKTAGRDRVSD